MNWIQQVFDLAPTDLLILFLASIFTAMTSAVLGGIGGVMQLSVMSFFYPYASLVPLHGFVQLFSNTTRLSFLKEHILKEYTYRFVVGVFIGGFFSYFAVREIKDQFWPSVIIALLILYVLFKPKKMPELKLPAKYYLFLGILSGFMGPIIAAGGPLISLFVYRSDWKKEQVIANQAVFQAVTHLIKIPVFLALGFNYLKYWAVISLLLVAVWVGTKFGVKLLAKINEKLFWVLLKIALTGAAFRLVYLAYTAS